MVSIADTTIVKKNNVKYNPFQVGINKPDYMNIPMTSNQDLPLGDEFESSKPKQDDKQVKQEIETKDKEHSWVDTAVEVGADLGAGVFGGIGMGLMMAGGPITLGAVAVGVGVASLSKLAIKGISTAARGKEYTGEQALKDSVTGGLMGLGGATSGLVKIAGKTTASFLAKETIIGAVFSATTEGGTEVARQTYHKVKDGTEFDGLKMLAKTGEGALGGAVFGGALGVARKTLAPVVKRIGKLLSNNNDNIIISDATCAKVISTNLNKVKFEKCTTIEEAKIFAEQKLGIKDFEIQDIDGANCILEMLTDLRNQSGDLGITSFNYVETIELPQYKNTFGIIAGYMNTVTGAMVLSNAGQRSSFADLIGSTAMKYPNLISKLLEKVSTTSLDSNFLFIVEQMKKDLKLQITGMNDIPFQTLKHEFAHRLHYLKCEVNNVNFWELGKEHEIKAAKCTNFEIYNEFKSKEIQEILNSFPFLGFYAKESPCEFVAELYPILLEGIEVPEKVIKLYVKYHGPSVHNDVYNIN